VIDSHKLERASENRTLFLIPLWRGEAATDAGGCTDKLRSLVGNRSGATAVEYGLLAALISVGLLLGLQSFAGSLENVLTLIAETIENA
jgi:pilus assembly protein Flp/PilA